MQDRGLGRAVMRVAAIDGWTQRGDRGDGNDLARMLGLHERGDCVHAVDRSVIIHFGYQMQQFRIKRAGLGIDRPPAPAASVRNQDVNAAPGISHFLHHPIDRVTHADIQLDADRLAAGGVDFVDRAISSHVARLGLELGVGFQAEIDCGDFRPQPGQAPRVGPSQAAPRTGDNGDLPLQLSQDRVPVVSLNGLAPSWPSWNLSAPT